MVLEDWLGKVSPGSEKYFWRNMKRKRRNGPDRKAGEDSSPRRKFAAKLTRDLPPIMWIASAFKWGVEGDDHTAAEAEAYWGALSEGWSWMVGRAVSEDIPIRFGFGVDDLSGDDGSGGDVDDPEADVPEERGETAFERIYECDLGHAPRGIINAYCEGRGVGDVGRRCVRMVDAVEDMFRRHRGGLRAAAGDDEILRKLAEALTAAFLGAEITE